MTITERDTDFQLEFPYRKHIIDAIKRTFDYSKRTYDPARKVWLIDKSETVGVKAFAEQFQFIWNKPQITPKVDYRTIPGMPKLEVDPMDYLNIEPFPYQKDGIAAFLKWKRVLCGDGMGSGKSMQSLAAVTIANAFPSLVICPSSLKYNWQDEWKKFANIQSIVLKGSIKNTWQNYHTVGRVKVFITNYESLMKYFVVKMPKGERFTLKDVEFNENIKIFKSVIVDECHRCKGSNTTQSRLTRGISAFMEYRFWLTGTPIVNTPKDLVPLLSGLGRLKELGGYTNFMNRYGSKEATDDDLAELNYKLRTTCFFMREKKDVLKDLPDKTRQIVHCDIANRKEYEKADQDFRNYLSENLGDSEEAIDTKMQGAIMVKIGILKRLAAQGKIKDTVEYIRNVNESGEKIVIFTWHKDIAKEIQQAFPTFKIIDGDVDAQVRHHYVTEFQNDPHAMGIICTIATGGVGYNMTASSIVLFIEMGWSPKDMDQAEDRCHRIGSKNAVFCPYMIGKDTIDEHIYDIINAKRKIVKAAFGIKHDIETDIIHDIIKIYKNK